MIRDNAMSSFAYSPDGKRVAIHTSRPDLLNVFDTTTAKSVWPKAVPATDIGNIAFSFPDGERLAGCSGNIVTIWDAETGTERQSLTGHTDRVETVAFSPMVTDRYRWL